MPKHDRILLTSTLLLATLVCACGGGGGETDAPGDATTDPASPGSYAIVDTGQSTCYDADAAIADPAVGQTFFGQDAQYVGAEARYLDHGDGTVTDLVTGLMWQ